MSKKVWQYDRVGGKYYGEIEDEIEVMAPLTDVPPLEGTRSDGAPLTINDQIYDPYERTWLEIINALDRNKLNNLVSLYPVLEDKNDVLKEKQENQEAQLTDTQLALAEVYEMLIPLDNKEAK